MFEQLRHHLTFGRHLGFYSEIGKSSTEEGGVQRGIRCYISVTFGPARQCLGHAGCMADSLTGFSRRAPFFMFRGSFEILNGVKPESLSDIQACRLESVGWMVVVEMRRSQDP